ncbi:protein of unknown function [Mesotoga infera]|uniref:Uncharacterized protein n=1 Tax=Mesotoga infera TaxID=1236046 RepID=A0A7Z7LEH0_9BACT|nr:protein of unknown function [Mesotoga infera]
MDLPGRTSGRVRDRLFAAETLGERTPDKDLRDKRQSGIVEVDKKRPGFFPAVSF